MPVKVTPGDPIDPLRGYIGPDQGCRFAAEKGKVRKEMVNEILEQKNIELGKSWVLFRLWLWIRFGAPLQDRRAGRGWLDIASH